MATTSTDPISDMLTRIRNAIAVGKHEVVLPHSKIKEAIARLLLDNRFIANISVSDETIGKMLTLTINTPDEPAKITEIVRLSTPGRRAYSRSQEIPVVKRGRGLVIVSTSKGLMTGDQAKSEHVGGELICKVF